MHSNKKRPPTSDTDSNWEANTSAKTRKVPRRKTGPSSPTAPTSAPNHSPTRKATTTTTITTTSPLLEGTEPSPTTSAAAAAADPIQTHTFVSSQHAELSIAVPVGSANSEPKNDEALTADDAVAAVAAAAALSNAAQHYASTEHLGHYHPQAEHELGHHDHQHYEHHVDEHQREYDPSVIAVQALQQQLQQHHMQQLQQHGDLHQNLSSENQELHHHHEQGHDVSDPHHHHHLLHDGGSDSADSRMFRSEHSEDRDPYGATGSGDGGTGSDGGQYKRTRGRGPSHALRNLSTDERRDRRLQRNRVAAKECRNKKKAYITTLEEKCAGLEEENIRLLKQVDELNAKFTLGTMRRLVNPSANGSNHFSNHNQPESIADPTATVPNHSDGCDKNLTHPAAHTTSQSDMARAAAAVAQAAGIDLQSFGAQLEAVASAGVSSASGSVESGTESTRVNHTEHAPSTPQPSHARQNEPSSSQSQSPAQQQPKVACA